MKTPHWIILVVATGVFTIGGLSLFQTSCTTSRPKPAASAKPVAVIHLLNPVTGEAAKTYEVRWISYGYGYVRCCDMQGRSRVLFGTMEIEEVWQ